MSRVLHIDPEHPAPEIIAQAIALLANDELVAFPTETVYGLGGHALHEKALAAIFAAKGRPATYPLIAHVADLEGAQALTTRWPNLATELARAFWPGPLTLVLPRAAHVPAALAGGKPSVAVRWPAAPVAEALIRALGAPLAAPSANPFQALSPTEASHVVRGLGEAVPLVLDGGPCRFGLELTVVDLTTSRPTLLRPGALPLGALRAVAPNLVLGSSVAESEAERHSPGQDAVHYAPRALLRLLPRTEAIAAAQSSTLDGGARAGLVLRGGDPTSDALVRVLPSDAAGFGRELFSALHALDQLGVGAIYVDAPPEDEAWAAVTDRLSRGAR